MTIYYYHHSTGEYMGTGEADENPREPGDFLIPGSATTAQPPEIPSGQRAFFRDEQWTLENITAPEPEPEPTPEPEPEMTMERFAFSQGYAAFDLLNLSDIQRNLEAQNIPLPEKSSAVREWVNSARVAFLTNQPPPSAPYSLNEVLVEILNLTQS